MPVASRKDLPKACPYGDTKIRRVVFLVLTLALAVVAWPATVAHAHLDVHAETNPHECQVSLWWDRHRDTDHTWEDHVSRDYGRWTIHLQLNLSPRGESGPYNYGGGYKELGPTHTPALFNLKDTIPLYGLSEDASWWWEAHYIFWTTNSRTGGLDFVKSGYVMSRNTHMVPRHCTTPPAPTPTPTPTPTPAPLCQFVGGFRSLVQNSQTGTCHNNEQPVAGGALQSADNGILFYNRVNPRLEFFSWDRLWHALAAASTAAHQPSQPAAQPDSAAAALRQCQFVGGFAHLVNTNPAPGNCYNNEQHVAGGAIQSTDNGILFYNRDNPRLEYFGWAQVWHALAAPPSAVTQPSPRPSSPAIPAIPAAPQCQFVLGFAHWVQTSPGVGACHNNELSVSGGSLQSAQNGILFYDRGNQRLAFFNWAQVWQAVAPLPFTQPQLPPSTETQTAAHCQFVLGFGNWVRQHSDAGACLHNEQFLASGSVQSTQNGILFYDSRSQRLGFFHWEHVWQGLVLLAHNP